MASAHFVLLYFSLQRPRSYPTFMPPRPLEGRVSRLVGPNQMVRCVVKDGRIVYVPWSPKIEIEMDKVSHGTLLGCNAIVHCAFYNPGQMSLEHPEYYAPCMHIIYAIENEQFPTRSLKALLNLDDSLTPPGNVDPSQHRVT